jgi:hypothetical protein
MVIKAFEEAYSSSFQDSSMARQTVLSLALLLFARDKHFIKCFIP